MDGTPPFVQVIAHEAIEGVDFASATLSARSTDDLAPPAPTNFVDTDAPSGHPYAYRVVAVDVNENPSVPSNAAQVDVGATSVEPGGLTSLTLRPNAPNPFSGSTTGDGSSPAGPTTIASAAVARR